MNSNHRYIPTYPFPSYVFVPGENPHPKKTGGHMAGEEEPVANTVDVNNPKGNEFLLYALDLYNHGYFWESHVYFEALWNAHERSGSEADFFKAMIKLGAAGVKLLLGQKIAARGHLERGRELLEAVKASKGREFMGFDLEQIIVDIDEALEGQTFQLQVWMLEG